MCVILRTTYKTCQGIELYKSLNVTRTHTAVSQFTNPDMAIGHFIENRIMPNVTSSGIDLIPKVKLYTQIAYMIFAKQRYGTTKVVLIDICA